MANAQGMSNDGVGTSGAQIIGRQPLENLVRQPVGGGKSQLERRHIGNAAAVQVGRCDPLLEGQRFDLGGGAVYQHQTDIERAQERDVHQDIAKVLVDHNGAIDADDERLLAELGDVLQNAPQVSQFHVNSKLG